MTFPRLLPLLLILGLALLSGCSQSPREGGTPTATPIPPPILGEIRIQVGDSVVRAEVARNQEQKSRGLMFRDTLPDGRGMLFPFERDGTYGFWMKNVRFPIDMLWLDTDLKVVHRESSVPGCPEEPCLIYRTPAPARYVLELPAGYAERHGIGMGSTLKLLDPLPGPVG